MTPKPRRAATLAALGLLLAGCPGRRAAQVPDPAPGAHHPGPLLGPDAPNLRIELSDGPRVAGPRAGATQAPAAAPSPTAGPALPGPAAPMPASHAAPLEPLRIIAVRCSSGFPCRPGAELIVEFSTPLRDLPGLRSRIRISPALTGAAYVADRELYITGATRPHTRHEVRLPADLEDVHGQRLGVARTLLWKVEGAVAVFDPGVGFIAVLDPTGPRALPVRTVNVEALQAQVHAFAPADRSEYLEASIDSWSERDQLSPRFGPPVFKGMVPVTGPKDQVVETAVELAAALPGGLGEAVVEVRPLRWTGGELEGPPRSVAWVQSTRIGLDAVLDGATLLARTTDLQTGAPLAGVRLGLGAAAARSDAAGLARLPLPTSPAALLTATLGDDVAALVGEDVGFARDPADPELRLFVVPDRDAHRPGETVRIKGWLRRHTRGPRGGLEPAAVHSLDYTLRDRSGVDLLGGRVRVGELGGFDLELPLPTTTTPGPTPLILAADGHNFGGPLHVEPLRPPVVTVRGAAGPHVVGGHVDLTAAVRSPAGAPRVGAELVWTVRQDPAVFTPPGHDEFTFGGQHLPRALEVATHSARTDAAGEHVLRARFAELRVHESTAVTAEASVQGGEGSASITWLVHPASLHVGLRSERRSFAAGEPLRIAAIVTDHDGRPISRRSIVLRAAPIDVYGRVGATTSECRLRSARAPVRCALAPPRPGLVSVTATVLDDQARAHTSELYVGAAGDPAPSSDAPVEERAHVFPERDSYRSGETAKLQVLAPFAPAEGLWTVRHDGIQRSGVFTMTTTSTTLELPIDAAMQPAAIVHVQLVGTRPHGERRTRPAFAHGLARLVVHSNAHRLDLSLETGTGPDARGSVGLTVRGADGRPVRGAEVTVFVVDEAALGDTGLADLFAGFHREPGPGAVDLRNRRYLPGFDPSAPSLFAPAIAPPPAGAWARMFDTTVRDISTVDLSPTVARDAPGVRLAGRTTSWTSPPRRRSGVDPLAAFAPTLPTDAEGRAHLTFTVPDARARYRVFVHAVAGARQFGAAETTLGARPPDAR